MNTNKAPTYGIAITQLKSEGKCPDELVHQQVKYHENDLIAHTISAMHLAAPSCAIQKDGTSEVCSGRQLHSLLLQALSFSKTATSLYILSSATKHSHGYLSQSP